MKKPHNTTVLARTTFRPFSVGECSRMLHKLTVAQAIDGAEMEAHFVQCVHRQSSGSVGYEANALLSSDDSDALCYLSFSADSRTLPFACTGFTAKEKPASVVGSGVSEVAPAFGNEPDESHRSNPN